LTNSGGPAGKSCHGRNWGSFPVTGLPYYQTEWTGKSSSTILSRRATLNCQFKYFLKTFIKKFFIVQIE
jgi:hypothetical protein